MSTIGKRTVFVSSGSSDANVPNRVEGQAQAAGILPGTLISFNALGIIQTSAGATVFGKQVLVADKDNLRQKSIDDAWVNGENVVAIAPRTGDKLNMIVASGNNLTALGVALTRNGAGLLRIAATNGTEEIVAYGDEVVNVTADALVRVVML